MLARSLRAAIISLFFVTFLNLTASAQVPDPVLAAEAPVPGAGHHYVGSGGETVNPADGSLSFHLPLQPAAGRQLSIPFGIRYSGSEQFYLKNGGTGGLGWVSNWADGQAPWQVGSWSYDLPVVTSNKSVLTSANVPDGCGPYGCWGFHLNLCWVSDNYVFRGLDGVQYSLPIASVWPESGNTLPDFCKRDPTNTGNAHGILSSLATDSSPLTVIDRSGTTYQFGSVTTIIDRNGNQITSSGNSYVDSTGRTAVAWTGIGHTGDQISVAGLGAPVTLKWTTTPVTFNETGYNVGGGAPCTLTAGAQTSISVVSEIDLPNGQKYTFQYDGTHGRVSKITFPDGGYVRYVWGLNRSSKETISQWKDSVSGITFRCDFIFDIPAITDRYVSFNGTTEVLHQQFSYSTTWAPPNLYGWTSKQTVVTTTDLLTNQSTKTLYTYGPVAADSPVYDPESFSAYLRLVPVETNVVYQDSYGGTYKTVNKSWANSHLMIGDQTILENGQGTATLRCYGAGEQVTNLYEYGFQSEGSKPADPSCTSSTGLNTAAIGPLRRQTATVFHSFPGVHILDAPDSVTVADGSGTTAKQTLFFYDETALQQSNAINLANPGSTRANITTLQRWISGTTYAKTTYQYFDTGQLYKMTDACGNTTCSDMTGANHTTTYSYGDSYASGTGTPTGQTFAYLTSVTFPNTGAAHTESFTWGYSDGQIRSRTDQNGRVTNFFFNDPGLLGRLTEIDSPDGGKTTVSYNDSPYNAANNTPSFTVSKSVTSSLSLATTTAFDGLGHKIRTITSDPQGATYTDIVYNGLAQAWKEYNPYRTTSDSTYGYKQNSYDPLGRIISAQMQDGSGSTAYTSYSGSCITVTDEAGNQRKSCNDSLGRLIEVDEPGQSAAGTASTGAVTISGSERTTTYTHICGPNGQTCTETIPDAGNVSITVNGWTATSSYGSTSTSANIAAALAAAINNNSSYPVSASSSGSVVNLTSKVTGANTNYPLATSSATTNTQYFTAGTTSFPATPSGSTLTGGTGGTGGYSIYTPAVTLYTYDVLGNMTCAVQKDTDTAAFTTCATASATWRPRWFTYDALSRLTSATNPESGTIQYTYDANSNVATRIAPFPNKIPADTSSPQTVTTTYTYDSLNRLIQKSYNDSPQTATVKYGYDGIAPSGCSPPVIGDTNSIGRRTSMCDASGATTWALDIVLNTGWKTTEKRTLNGVTGTTISQANLGGMVAQLTYPSGRVINYAPNSSGSYTAARYLSATDSNGTAYVNNATYAAFGGITGFTNAATSTITTSNSYNERLQPVVLSASTTAATLISLSYNFHRTAGDNGLVYQVVNNIDNNRTQTYTYDPLNRVATAYSQAPSGTKSWGETFTIDAWSNLTNRGPVSGKTNYEALNAPATVKNQVSGYCYDLAGNLLGTSACPNLPYTPTYTYDAENRVKAVNGVTYTYDGDGNRVLKSSGTLYWGAGPLAESDLSASSASWKEYVFFNGKRMARRDASNSTVHYFFSNHVGSTSMIVNSSTGAVEEDVDYSPYGGTIYVNLGTSDHYLFDGKERDSETGNDNFGARYYGSGMGRFLTPDWAARPTAIPYAVFGDPQSLNLYTMVRNDPVTLADADGHKCDQRTGQGCPNTQELQKADGDKAKAEGAKSNDAAKAAQNKPTLPQNPSGLGDGWKNVTPGDGKNPKIPQRFRGPNGTEVEFDPADSTKSPKTWGGKDHWHEVDPKTGKRVGDHLPPGSPIPGPDGNPTPTEQPSSGNGSTEGSGGPSPQVQRQIQAATTATEVVGTVLLVIYYVASAFN